MSPTESQAFYAACEEQVRLADLRDEELERELRVRNARRAASFRKTACRPPLPAWDDKIDVGAFQHA